MDRKERPPRIRAYHPGEHTLPKVLVFVYSPCPPLQVFALYLSIFYTSTAARQRKLKSEILLNKKELLQTSAQDQFAKWAKLRRSVDKGLADLEKLSKSGGPPYCSALRWSLLRTPL